METDRPAEILRRATALMRERAEAARELTDDGHGGFPPWGVVAQTVYRKHPEPVQVPVPFAFNGETMTEEGTWVPTGEAFVAHERWAHDTEEEWPEADSVAGPVPEAIAAHIAAVHPGVTLALADWLDAAAALLDAQVFPESDPAMAKYPLAVARTYLGEAELPRINDAAKAAGKEQT